jgi:hypothetical protein
MQAYLVYFGNQRGDTEYGTNLEVKTHRKNAYKPAVPKKTGRKQFHKITLTIPSACF